MAATWGRSMQTPHSVPLLPLSSTRSPHLIFTSSAITTSRPRFKERAGGGRGRREINHATNKSRKMLLERRIYIYSYPYTRLRAGGSSVTPSRQRVRAARRRSSVESPASSQLAPQQSPPPPFSCCPQAQIPDVVWRRQPQGCCVPREDQPSTAE